MDALIGQLGSVLVEYGLAGVVIASMGWLIKNERDAHQKTRDSYETAREKTRQDQEAAFERIRQSHLDDLKAIQPIASANTQAMENLTRTVQAVLDALAARERT